MRRGELTADTLVRLDVVTGRRFVPLGELELFETLADPEERRFRWSLRNAAPLVTAVLVGSQVRVYLWSKLPGAADLLVDRFTNWAPAVLETGEVYRLLTYGFLHLSFTHLALNMLFLAYAGMNLERAMGGRNLASVYLVSVITGGLLSMMMSPGRPSLGASGGDFGLIAASVVFGWKHEDRLPEVARQYFGWAILPYLVYPLFLGISSSTVDNWGHLGGLFGGAAMATWLQPDAFERYRAENRFVRRAVMALCVGTLIGVAAWGPRLVPLSAVEVGGLSAPCPRPWKEGWTFTDDWGRLSETRKAAFVATTRTYSRPLSTDEAVDAFIEQLDARAQAIQVTRKGSVQVGGWEAARLTLRFNLAGTPQVMEALLITQGAHVYRVHLHAEQSQGWRYAQLAARMFQGVTLDDPPELEEARLRSQRNRRSWKPAWELGRAAATAGYPEEAEQAFERAYRYAREKRPRVAVSILAYYADYPSRGSIERVRELVEAHSDDVRVVLQAAEAYDRMGASDMADALLQEARVRWPEEYLIERAMQTRAEP